MNVNFYWHNFFSGIKNVEQILEEIQPTIDKINNGEYKAAGVELKSAAGEYPIYGAKVNEKARILFTTFEVEGAQYPILLDYLPNHEYHRSPFLRNPSHVKQYFEKNGNAITKAILDAKRESEQPNSHANHNAKEKAIYKPLYIFDKHYIELSAGQNEACKTSLPAVVTGEPGSGKTSLLIPIFLKEAEKYRGSNEEIRFAYVTPSTSLVTQMKEAWEDVAFVLPENIHLDCFTYDELIKQMPEYNNHKEKSKKYFLEDWLKDSMLPKPLQGKGELIYQELRTLSGYDKKTYLNEIGKRQSLFPDQKEALYGIYTNYCAHLKTHNFYDPALLSFKESMHGLYQLVAVDEGQSLSLMQQRNLALSAQDTKIVVCQDEKQNVEDRSAKTPQTISLLTKIAKRKTSHTHLIKSYRSPPKATQLASALEDLKLASVGGKSYKKETLGLSSADLLKDHPGRTFWVKEPLKNGDKIKELLQKLYKTKKAAIITHEAHKKTVEKNYGFSVLFTPAEIRGLGYEFIIMIDLIDPPTWKDVNTQLAKVPTSSKDTSKEQHQPNDGQGNNEQHQSKEKHQPKNGRGNNALNAQFNNILIAVTRARNTVIIVQKEHHSTKNIFDYLCNEGGLQSNEEAILSTLDILATTTEQATQEEEEALLKALRDNNNNEQANALAADIKKEAETKRKAQAQSLHQSKAPEATTKPVQSSKPINLTTQEKKILENLKKQFSTQPQTKSKDKIAAHIKATLHEDDKQAAMGALLNYRANIKLLFNENLPGLDINQDGKTIPLFASIVYDNEMTNIFIDQIDKKTTEKIFPKQLETAVTYLEKTSDKNFTLFDFLCKTPNGQRILQRLIELSPIIRKSYLWKPLNLQGCEEVFSFHLFLIPASGSTLIWEESEGIERLVSLAKQNKNFGKEITGEILCGSYSIAENPEIITPLLKLLERKQGREFLGLIFAQNPRLITQLRTNLFYQIYQSYRINDLDFSFFSWLVSTGEGFGFLQKKILTYDPNFLKKFNKAQALEVFSSGLNLYMAENKENIWSYLSVFAANLHLLDKISQMGDKPLTLQIRDHHLEELEDIDGLSKKIETLYVLAQYPEGLAALKEALNAYPFLALSLSENLFSKEIDGTTLTEFYGKTDERKALFEMIKEIQANDEIQTKYLTEAKFIELIRPDGLAELKFRCEQEDALLLITEHTLCDTGPQKTLPPLVELITSEAGQEILNLIFLKKPKLVPLLSAKTFFTPGQNNSINPLIWLLTDKQGIEFLKTTLQKHHPNFMEMFYVHKIVETYQYTFLPQISKQEYSTRAEKLVEAYKVTALLATTLNALICYQELKSQKKPFNFEITQTILVKHFDNATDESFYNILSSLAFFKIGLQFLNVALPLIGDNISNAVLVYKEKNEDLTLIEKLTDQAESRKIVELEQLLSDLSKNTSLADTVNTSRAASRIKAGFNRKFVNQPVPKTKIVAPVPRRPAPLPPNYSDSVKRSGLFADSTKTDHSSMEIVAKFYKNCTDRWRNLDHVTQGLIRKKTADICKRKNIDVENYWNSLSQDKKVGMICRIYEEEIADMNEPEVNIPK